MKKSSYLIALTFAALAFSSCNTFIGAGRDLQGLGRGIQNKGTTGTWDGNGPAPAAAPAAQNPYGVPAAR